MANDTSNGTRGDAPRTLFSLGRGGKRARRGESPSPLEEYPPLGDDAGRTATATDVLDPEPTDAVGAHAESCSSCGEPLVTGAVFCGECGTRVTPVEEAAAEADERVAEAEDLEEAEVEEPAAEAEEPVAEAEDLEVAEVEEPAAEADEPVAEAEDLEVAEVEEPAAEVEAPLDEADADEVVEEPMELVDADTEIDEHPDLAPIAAVTGAVAAATVGVAGAEDAEASGTAPVVDAGPELAPVADGAEADTSPGSKKGVWIAVGAVAATLAVIVGVLAVAGGGSKDDRADGGQVAAVSPSSTTATTEATSTTATTSAPVSTDTTAAPVSTDTTAAAPDTTSAVPGPAPAPAPAPTAPRPSSPPPTASPANLLVSCPGTIRSTATSGASGQIVLFNNGGTAAQYNAVFSAPNSVALTGTSGTVPPGGRGAITISIPPNQTGATFTVNIQGPGGGACSVTVDHV